MGRKSHKDANDRKAYAKCKTSRKRNNNNKQTNKQTNKQNKQQHRGMGANTHNTTKPKQNQSPRKSQECKRLLAPYYNEREADPCLLSTIQPPLGVLVQKLALVVNSRVTESGTATATKRMWYTDRVLPPPVVHVLKVNSSESVSCVVPEQTAADISDTVNICPSWPSGMTVNLQAPEVLPAAVMYR